MDGPFFVGIEQSLWICPHLAMRKTPGKTVTAAHKKLW